MIILLINYTGFSTLTPHKYEAITDFLDNEIANIQLCRLRSNIQSRSHFFVEVDSKIHIYLLIFTINIS